MFHLWPVSSAATRIACRRHSPTPLALLAAMLVGCASSGTQDGGGAADFARTEELAPIEEAELVVRESFPPQYAVRVVSGLASGCAQFERVDVERNGNVLALTVWNSVPADASIACTMIYGTTENVVELGTELRPGEAYVVRINRSEQLRFVVQ